MDAPDRIPMVFDEAVLVRLVDESRARQGLAPRLADRTAIEDLLTKLRSPKLAAARTGRVPRREQAIAA